MVMFPGQIGPGMSVVQDDFARLTEKVITGIPGKVMRLTQPIKYGRLVMVEPGYKLRLLKQQRHFRDWEGEVQDNDAASRDRVCLALDLNTAITDDTVTVVGRHILSIFMVKIP